jgi:2-dehydropantoate 2-reductase
MKNKNIRVGIIGMGAIGMILAVHFKKAGCMVAICDSDKDKMYQIRKDGIHLTGNIEHSSYFDYVTISVEELLDLKVDILISCVKTYHVGELLEQLDKMDKNIHLLAAQDGIDICQKYIKICSESQVLRMVVNYAGNIVNSNTVRVTYYNSVSYIGSINDRCHEIAQWLAEKITKGGHKTEAVDSFQTISEVWKKSILVAAIGPICGISRLNLREAMSSSDTVEIIEQTIIESMEVAKAEGVKFEENFIKLCLRTLKEAGDHLPSLGLDIGKGIETEIDYFNGKIVSYGVKHYIQTPLNLTFTNIINAMHYKKMKNK